MWYEIELGRSCFRSRGYGKALKNLRSVCLPGHSHMKGELD